MHKMRKKNRNSINFMCFLNVLVDRVKLNRNKTQKINPSPVRNASCIIVDRFNIFLSGDGFSVPM